MLDDKDKHEIKLCNRAFEKWWRTFRSTFLPKEVSIWFKFIARWAWHAREGYEDKKKKHREEREK